MTGNMLLFLIKLRPFQLLSSAWHLARVSTEVDLVPREMSGTVAPARLEGDPEAGARWEAGRLESGLVTLMLEEQVTES